ncbi:hypothetical protein GCM10023153_17020 [Ornithinibacter aureus]|uniref:Uncharacterized protein n=1 Tax=Ornithinibacter aureus TaxID=622664 RepID=A0ABP8JS47_9MICO|nr:hypothetical protein [Ornithinibacter aureus]KAF0833304.1 hypothetical protein C8E84_1085 [Ornithinibacter aureus]
MGLFSRKRNEPAPPLDTTPDSDLTFFTRPQAEQFRATVRRVLAEDGYEVTVHPDHVETDDGLEWGLWNVAAVAHNESDPTPEGWAEVIRRHFRALLAADRPSADTLSDEQYRSQLYLRLVEESSLDSLGRESFGHALSWADGVVSLPVVDLPDMVITPAEDRLRERGPMAALLDQAHRNTRALVTTEPLQIERIEHEGHWFWCVLGESMFTASLALVLPDVVERVEPGADLRDGVVFAVPFRHQLAFRVVDGATAAMDALTLMPRFAVLGFSDSPGPLSPHTYLWHDGAVSQLTHRGEDGVLNVVVGPHLGSILSVEQGGDTR